MMFRNVLAAKRALGQVSFEDTKKAWDNVSLDEAITAMDNKNVALFPIGNWDAKLLCNATSFGLVIMSRRMGNFCARLAFGEDLFSREFSVACACCGPHLREGGVLEFLPGVGEAGEFARAIADAKEASGVASVLFQGAPAYWGSSVPSWVSGLKSPLPNWLSEGPIRVE